MNIRNIAPRAFMVMMLAMIFLSASMTAAAFDLDAEGKTRERTVF